MSTGAELIAAERHRQYEGESWTAEQDATYVKGELLDAARCYLNAPAPGFWPWALMYFKPTPDDRVRELVKAGALIAAEIDRLVAGQKAGT